MARVNVAGFRDGFEVIADRLPRSGFAVLGGPGGEVFAVEEDNGVGWSFAGSVLCGRDAGVDDGGNGAVAVMRFPLGGSLGASDDCEKNGGQEKRFFHGSLDELELREIDSRVEGLGTNGLFGREKPLQQTASTIDAQWEGYMIIPMASRVLFALFFLAFGSELAGAQVRITVRPGPFKPRERIVATVTNPERDSVVVCIEIGQSSQIGEDRESTPYPFFVQKFVRNKWSPLLIGPDVGSFRATSVLKAGESVEFPFALNDTGKMRLLLEYWPNEATSDKCPAKGAKSVRSNPFVVRR